MKRSEVNALCKTLTNSFGAADSTCALATGRRRLANQGQGGGARLSRINWAGTSPISARPLQTGWPVPFYGAQRQPGGDARKGRQALLREDHGGGEKQLTPLHHHWIKIEDIINRGGGKLMLRLFNATKDAGLKDTPVVATLDG